jgi:hypothetical protein
MGKPLEDRSFTRQSYTLFRGLGMAAWQRASTNLRIYSVHHISSYSKCVLAALFCVCTIRTFYGVPKRPYQFQVI